ncbi:MAB_1171c family putative transporter [Streptomyces sp. NPDC059002]|uniref:MAB_1171c family putative transporter n=1 Tax=Streptomyces sp. NPDC059002 TaxID=3346690 RepID=UPI0036A7F5A4
MTSDDYIALLTIIPLWVVVAVRANARRGHTEPNPGKDALLWTFVALAIGTTLRLSPLEHALASVTGLRDCAVLPKHLSIVTACLLLVGWVNSAVPARSPEPRWRRLADLKPRLILGAVAATAALATFPGAAPARLAPNGDTDFINGQFGDGWGTIYLCVYLLPIGVALALSAALCAAAANRSPAGAFRRCMQMMALGCGLGVTYPLYRLTYLGYGLAGAEFPLTEDQFDMGGNLLQIATILPVVAGSSIRAIDIVARGLRNRRALIGLRPLWVDLVCVLSPDTVRKHLVDGTSLIRDRWGMCSMYNRLDQRVVEVWDATYELLPWVDEDLPTRALAAVRAEGFTGDDAEAAAEAVCLRIARRRAVDGESHAFPSTVEPLLTLRDDQEANARWLTRVGAVYTSTRLDGVEKALTTVDEKVGTA